MVFNPVSGATHLLDIASGDLLLALMEGPARPADLAARLAALLEVEADQKMRAAVETILERLDSLGLAEPCPQ